MTTTSRAIFAGTIIALLTTSTSGCGAFRQGDYPLSGPTMTATANPQDVTAEQFGHSWALDVDHGTVGCAMNDDGDPMLTFTAPDGTVYALNAVRGNRDLPDISKIAHGSVGTLRTFAFTVCDT